MRAWTPAYNSAGLWEPTETGAEAEAALELAIETRGLTKRYRDGLLGRGRGILALDSVDISVPRGVCFGLLGPNGAGKSTLVKTLLSIVLPTSGSATLLGQDIRSTEARRDVGYLAEGHAFPPHLTGRGVCRYMGRLAGLNPEELESEIRAKLELVSMTERADDRITKYSKGMKQRIGLAQALLGSPRLVFLDEPTDGVDPVGRKDVRDIVRTAVKGGVTMFVNSHQLAELELMCDEVAILHEGKLLHDGSVEEVRELISARRAKSEVRFRTGPVPAELASSLGVVSKDGKPVVGFTLHLATEEVTPLIDRLRAAGVAIHAVEPRRVSLEDAFVAIVEGADGGDA